MSVFFILERKKVICYGSNCGSLLKCSKRLVSRGGAAKAIRDASVWLKHNQRYDIVSWT